MRVSSVQISGQMPDTLVPTESILQLYRDGTLSLKKDGADAFYQQVIDPLKSQVISYCMEFDMASKSYLANHSMLSKMSNVIMDPAQSMRGKNISDITGQAITNKNLNDKKRSTEQMIATMKRGHNLLLQIRKAFTGSSISTKFIVQYQGKTFTIDESFLDSNLILSAYGGGTVSNPFSLAYQLSVDMLQTEEFLNNAEEITNEDVWTTIYGLKPEYLRRRSEITHRVYKNIYFDSKDAEIYEYYIQNKELITSLTVDSYAKFRRNLGGGGGYATPFYKMGDIGNTQVKFFNFRENQKNVTVNFARFSLLRDRFQELYDILNQDSLQNIGKGLQQFFTEKESQVISGVSAVINREAKQAFETIFNIS